MTSQFLRLKEGPFLLTLLLGATAWLIAHAVDRLKSAPIIEYRLSEHYSPDGTVVSCRIENLSTDRCFRNLKFTLKGPDSAGRLFTNSQVIHFPPGATKNEPSPPSPKVESREVSIIFNEFHPRWAFEFRTKKVGDFRCELWVATDLKEGKPPDTTQAVELRPVGAATILIRYEMEILAGLLGLALVLAIIYLAWLNRSVARGARN